MNVKPLQSISTAILGATSVMTVVVGLAAQETFGNFIAWSTNFSSIVVNIFAITTVIKKCNQKTKNTVFKYCISK